jgi:rubrerythrin
MPAVGVQKNMQDVIVQLVRSEREIIELYEAALAAVRVSSERETLLAFRDDHIRHWKEFVRLSERPASAGPKSSAVVSIAPQRQLPIVNLESDRELLVVLREKEENTLAIYHQWATSQVVPARLRLLFRACLEDVRRHLTRLPRPLGVRKAH